MQLKRPRPQTREEIASEVARRSVCRAGTASRDSSIGPDSTDETEATYQAFRPQSQPISYNNQSGENIPNRLYASGDHPALEQIHRYNSSHGIQVDPQLPGHGAYQPPASAHNSGHLDGSYVGAEALQQNGLVFPGREMSMSVPPGANNGTDVEKKEKKNASTTAANERELRELLEKNGDRTLESIVRDVRNAERSQKSEKAKQLFAMRWLSEYCKQDKESVPRNRVYTHYAQRCGTDRVDTLNPASFGKLVRIIFPGIQTRRLGVRGESKYHYVNLTLRDDPPAGSIARPGSAQNGFLLADRAASFEPEPDFHAVSRVPVDTAAFPPQGQDFDRPPPPTFESNPPSEGRLFADPYAIGARPDGLEPTMYMQTLRFSSANEAYLQDQPMTLPSIHPFLPPRTDIDIADALTALYRTHCTSLVDALRYVREKQFMRLLAAFNGTLTVPVAKLFAHPTIAPWIKMCDWLMYQQIVQFISHLALQVIPPPVFAMLGNLSSTLTQHLRRNLQQYPDHVLQAKLEPATVFASLMQRLLRVNETAHAASHLLSSDQMRNAMWQDWVRSVRPKRVLETELPGCGYEEAYEIITTEIRQLLEPLGPSDWYEAGTEYQVDPFSSSRQVHQFGALNATSDTILNKWADFVRSLPSRFPRSATRTLLNCVNAVGTATLRDITVNQGESFGCWWITKVWVDEMMLWLAEMGGFLDASASILSSSPPRSESLDSLSANNHYGHRNSSERHQPTGLGIDFQQLPDFGPVGDGFRPPTGMAAATFKYSTEVNVKPGAVPFDGYDSQEDSGIGMSLLSNDLNASKITFLQPQGSHGETSLVT